MKTIKVKIIVTVWKIKENRNAELSGKSYLNRYILVNNYLLNWEKDFDAQNLQWNDM